MKQMSYVTRWLYSTSHKDIGILYLGFGMLSAMVGTAMSVIIRMELSNGNSQFLHGNNQAFNVLVSGHALMMIFFFIMPVFMGAFGNFFLPIMIGAVDMAFARLNNISFWCLPPALVCIIASVLVEQGAGTGWTLEKLEFKKIPFDAWNPSSYTIVWYLIEYSYFNLNIVKIFIIIGQYACIYINKNLIYIHQRLNMVIFKLFYSSLTNSTTNETKNIEKDQQMDKHYNKDNVLNFNEWLVGFTDGDGTFNVYKNIELNKLSFTYKLTQSIYNVQLLYKIKHYLGVGQVVFYEKNKASYILRNKKHISTILFPIFEKYPLLTSKYYDYKYLKKSIDISNKENLSLKDKIYMINNLNYLNYEELKSPVWKDLNYKDIKSVKQIYKIMSKSWLVGFIEAEGSFYYVNKTPTRIVHAFGITQKLDPIILYSIKHMLHITSNVKYKLKHNYYIIETVNNRSINYIINYFILNNHKNIFLGMKSFEFNLWKRTYTKYKNNSLRGDTQQKVEHYSKLIKIRQIVRSLKRNNNN